MIVEPRRDVTRDGHRAKVEPVTQDVESGLGLTKTRLSFIKHSQYSVISKIKACLH